MANLSDKSILITGGIDPFKFAFVKHALENLNLKRLHTCIIFQTSVNNNILLRLAN
jgi:hypothetical protein